MVDQIQIEGHNQITTVRLFKYPQSLVFKAWTDPVHLAKWWGPKGFTNTFLEFDLNPGGDWKFIMHGPDGSDYENHCVFVSITPHVSLIFDHLGWHKFRVFASFEKETDSSTLVTFRQVFENPIQSEDERDFLIKANEENFDKLDKTLKAIDN